MAEDYEHIIKVKRENNERDEAQLEKTKHWAQEDATADNLQSSS